MSNKKRIARKVKELEKREFHLFCKMIANVGLKAEIAGRTINDVFHIMEKMIVEIKYHMNSDEFVHQVRMFSGIEKHEAESYSLQIKEKYRPQITGLLSVGFTIDEAIDLVKATYKL